MTRNYVLPALAVTALAMAACSSSSTPATSPTQAPHTAKPAAKTAAKGPFTAKLIHCGTLDKMLRAKFSTHAKAGAVISVTNRGKKALSPQIQVAFSNGGKVVSRNTSGYGPVLSHGQSADAEVDNVTGSKAGNPADTCVLTGYAARSAAGKAYPGPVRGGWTLKGSMKGTK